MSDQSLPFPRGETYHFANTSAATATAGHGAQYLEGREFDTFDGAHGVGKGHGTGLPVTLRVMRNDSGANIKRANGSVAANTANGTSNQYGKAGGYTTVNGTKGFLIDDALNTNYNIVDNDLFYVVIKGPCDARVYTGGTAASATNIDQGDVVMLNGNGKAVDLTAGLQGIGRWATASPTAASGYGLVMVDYADVNA